MALIIGLFFPLGFPQMALNTVRTLMSPNVKLTIDLLGKSVDSSFYTSMIGSFLTSLLVDLTLVTV